MCKKLTIEDVKQKIEESGYTLLSTEYVNSSTKLDLLCPNGHKIKKTWNNFQVGYRCQICAKNTRLTIEEIKQKFEEKNYKLISTKYKNNNTKLNTICPNGHKWKTSWNNFQIGNRCDKCCINNGTHTSKAEKDIVYYIKSIYKNTIVENDRTLLKNPLTGYPLELDIYLPDINKAIELNSMYWHNKPDVKQRDMEKVKQCKDKNIMLLVIDYDNWKRNKRNHEKIIYNFLNG